MLPVCGVLRGVRVITMGSVSDLRLLYAACRCCDVSACGSYDVGVVLFVLVLP